MKKNTKKSAPKTKPTQPAVLRVVSPITAEEASLENLPVRPRDNRLPADGNSNGYWKRQNHCGNMKRPEA